MNESQLHFQFRGPEGRAAAEELAGFLQNDFVEWQPRVEEQAPSPEVEKVDPVAVASLAVAVASLIISIPAGILATWDLAQRIQHKRKVVRLITWAKDRAARGEAIPVLVLPPHEEAVPLDQVRPEQILDAIAVQAAAQREQRP